MPGTAFTKERHDGDSSESERTAVALEQQEPQKRTTKNGVELIPQPSDNPRDPLNWSMWKKCTIYAIMIFGTFTGVATAIANILATPEQAKSWDVTPTEAGYSVSAVVAGIVVGPVILVPLVRLFGVMSCCFWSMIFLAVTSVWSAVSAGPNDYGSFITSRLIAGLFSSIPQILTTGVIGHIFFLHQRGKALAIYSTSYMIAQLSGSTFSGYMAQFASWPVCFWWTVGANGFAAILFFLFGEETAWDRQQDRPISRKTIPDSWWARRRALFLPGTQFGAPDPLRSSAKSLQAVFAIGLSPVTVLAGIYGLFAYGWYVMASVQVPLILATPASEQGYGFSPAATSNFYFSAWIGAFVGVVYGILLNDRLPLWLKKRNNGIWKAEFRLHTAWLPGLIVAPVGYGIFGASVYYHWHWICFAVGECMLVFGAVASLPPTVNYVIEIFTDYPQEVGAALNIWRLGFSIAVQFFYEPWVHKIGVNWVWGTAAFLSLLGFGCVAILMWNGSQLRKFNLWSDDGGHENRQGTLKT